MRVGAAVESGAMDGSDHLPERGLEAAWARLEGLIDWERRERKPGKRGQAMRVDLEPVRELARRCGAPQAGRRFVHVSGTKGKGSVASLVACGLGAAGLRVVRYGSPHVERLHERITVYEGGVQRAVTDAELAFALHAALDARAAAIAELAEFEAEHGTGNGVRGNVRVGERLDAHVAEGEPLAGGRDFPAAEATWFDVLTCAALIVMRELDVEWGVFECGLGGRLDSTNLIAGEVCVLTNVDLEHTEVLGGTRALIAREKVAIAKRGATLVTGVREDDEIAPILRAHVGADVVWALGGDAPATLAELNRKLAGAALDALAARGAIAAGSALLSAAVCAQAGLPGRMEVMEWQGLTVVLDGAHVASSLAAVLRELGTRPELARPPVVVFGTGKDKDVAGLLKVLGERVDRLICTSVGSQTAVPPGELVENAKRFVVGAQSASTPRIALDQARALCSLGDWVLVTGSLHLIGAVRPLLRTAP